MAVDPNYATNRYKVLSEMFMRKREKLTVVVFLLLLHGYKDT